MSQMFGGCSSLINLNLSTFNTENVTDMNSMFSDCTSLTYINLSSFNKMFNLCITCSIDAILCLF